MGRMKAIGIHAASDEDIRSVLSAHMARVGITKTGMGKAIGISGSGFCKKYKCPEKFTVGELRRSYDYLKVPKEERVGLK